MSIVKFIRKIVHDGFYALAPTRAKRYVLTCREAVQSLDTGAKLPGPRLWLHLRLCQACNNYWRYSEWLKQILRQKNGERPGLEALIFRKIKDADERTPD